MTNVERKQALTQTAELALRRSWIAGKVNGQPVTLGELQDAFARVKPQPNWKYPICAHVTTAKNESDSAAELALIREAVIHFCGCVPEFRHEGNFRFLVTAVGYYEAVGP